jgi:hypothetical protein
MTLDHLKAAALFVLAAGPAMGQQTYVTRYDVFVGAAYLNSPAISLPEHGVQFQIGFRPKTWYSVGFDYSNVKGDLTLTPDLLPDALQQRLGAQLAQLAAAGQLPAGYHLVVPANSSTQSFSFGPQLAFRHFKSVTLFVRPSMGAIREVAVPQPGDAIAKAIATQLVPSGRKRDWTGFYGAGGGFDINFSKHFAFRVQGDLVWDHLFNDVLKNGRKTFRLGIGPCFNFGRNIVQ